MYSGENVVVALTKLLGVCKRLASVNALTSDTVRDVLTGPSICNNTRFKEMFSQLARSKDSGNVDIFLLSASLNLTRFRLTRSWRRRSVCTACFAKSVSGTWPKRAKVEGVTRRARLALNPHARTAFVETVTRKVAGLRLARNHRTRQGSSGVTRPGSRHGSQSQAPLPTRRPPLLPARLS